MTWKLIRELQLIFATPIRLLVVALSFLGLVIRAIRDWIVLRAWAWTAIVMVCLKSFLTRTRMSHDNGIATRVRIQFLPELDVPDNDFFQPNRAFIGRCRFACIGFNDDARLVGRAASLKFADSRKESPLDILMNCGDTVLFNNVRSFWGFMICSIKGRADYAIPYMRQDPSYYLGAKNTLRAVPESYVHMDYGSKVPLTFTGSDGVPRYIKFRMLPDPLVPETGKLSPAEELDWAWCWQGIRPGETRGRNYLKDELRARLEREKPRFRLQMQLLDQRDDEHRSVLDCGLYWDEKVVPWRDLGDVTVEEALSYEESNLTLLTMRNRPKSMGIVRARSIDDPAGINYMRELGVWARRARLLGNRLFGIPKPTPDERSEPIAYTPFLTEPPLGPFKPISLPQRDDSGQRASRREEIKLTRADYPIVVPGNLPTHAGKLPEIEIFDGHEQLRMFDDIGRTVASLGLAGIERLTESRKTLDMYDEMYPFRTLPTVHKRWRSDVEFAQQRLNGVNPAMIELCEELPEHFPVRDQHVREMLDPGRSLKKELKAGRIFLSDYAILDGVKTADVSYLPASMCLFYAPRNGPLLPIAIQLGQSPKDGPIFTPKDDPWLWLTVKTFAQSADAACHEVLVHLLRTHMLMETVYLGARRQLAERHPLMELLAPHFKFTLAINDAARTSMLVPGGPLPLAMAAGYDGSIEILERGFAKWSFDRFNLYEDLSVRGVDRKDADGHYILQGYHYRDDALASHRIIDGFVREVIEHFYRSDEDVALDEELRGWLAEMADPKRGNLRGLPGDGLIEDRETLIRFVSQIVFHTSAEHGAVNNGQYEYFGYIPNVPGAMHKKPPTTKDPLSEEWLVEALPGGEQSSMQLAMVHLLSEPAEWTLGSYPEGFFQGHLEIRQAMARFHDRLERLSLDIRSRNALLDVPYDFLDPRDVSNSILI